MLQQKDICLKARGFNEKCQQEELVEATLLHPIEINESFLSLCQGLTQSRRIKIIVASLS